MWTFIGSDLFAPSDTGLERGFKAAAFADRLDAVTDLLNYLRVVPDGVYDTAVVNAARSRGADVLRLLVLEHQGENKASSLALATALNAAILAENHDATAILMSLQ
jgi:hypothetical protein